MVSQSLIETIIPYISALSLWSALFVLLPVLVRFKKAKQEHKKLYRHYILCILPIGLLNLIFLSTKYQFLDLFYGLNIIVITIIYLGRFQFIRYVYNGESKFAYSQKWEVYLLGAAILLFGYMRLSRALGILDSVTGSIFSFDSNSTRDIRQIFVISFFLVMESTLMILQHREVTKAKQRGIYLPKLITLHWISILGLLFRCGLSIMMILHFNPGIMIGLALSLFAPILFVVWSQSFVTMEIDQWQESVLQKKLSNKALFTDFLSRLDLEHLYKRSDVTIKDCAVMMNVSEHSMRSSISEYSREPLSNILNWYRAKALYGLFEELGGTHTLQALGQEVGFTSVSTMRRAIQYFYEESPSQFVKGQRSFSALESLAE